MQEEESNVERKEKGEALSGGESSAEYIISKSEGENQVPDKTKKISPTTDTIRPTRETTNVDKKERGEALPGGESSAEYMTSRAGEQELSKEPEAGKDEGSITDKLKAGAKAMKNKATDSDRDLKTEYEQEKLKE
jgi:hypothetical protein